jgi:DUF1009 family protein
VERSLGLMAGAGILPGRAATEARRRGWRVTAFAFEEAPGLAAAADDLIPSTITDIQAVLAELVTRRIEAVLFVGKFWKSSAFSHYDRADDAGRGLARGGLSDAALARMVEATLAGMHIAVLDQREFLAPWLLPAGALTARAPAPAEWDEIREGFPWPRASPPMASARRWSAPAASRWRWRPPRGRTRPSGEGDAWRGRGRWW